MIDTKYGNGNTQKNTLHNLKLDSMAKDDDTKHCISIKDISGTTF